MIGALDEMQGFSFLAGIAVQLTNAVQSSKNKHGACDNSSACTASMAIDGDMETFSLTEEGAGFKVYNKIESHIKHLFNFKRQEKPGDKPYNEKLHQFQKITFRSEKKRQSQFFEQDRI